MFSSETKLILMGRREYLSKCIWYDEASFTSIGKGTSNYFVWSGAIEKIKLTWPSRGAGGAIGGAGRTPKIMVGETLLYEVGWK